MPSTKPKGQRYRICGTPSRLGCLTCKIRRVKCGEEKPFCKRCTSTGRKCDGYGPPPTSTAIQRKAPPPRCNPAPSMENPMEQRLLYFFTTVTAPCLTGPFSTEFWQRKVVQMSTVEPAIRRAVIAIGAIHQDFINRRHNPENNSDSFLQAFAFRQYTIAINNLHSMISNQTHKLDMTLIACILFICIDCLFGNHASAIIHLEAGLRILQTIQTQKEQNEHKGICAEDWERDFSPSLIALGVQAATFANPRFPKERTAVWNFLKAAGIHSKPMVFRSLDEARYALDTISAEIMADRTCANSITEHTSADPSGVVAQKHLSALYAWSEALDHYNLEYVKQEPLASKTRHGATLLKVHSLVVSIVIGRPEDADKKFEDILVLCELLIATGCFSSFNTNLHFSTDQGVIPPLFFTALRAQDPCAKHRALDLLARAPGREGMWDTEDAIRIAEDAQKDRDGQGPILVPPTAPVQNNARIWGDVAVRLESRMAFGE